GADECLDHLGVLLRPGEVGLGHEEAGANGVHGDAARRPVGGGGAGEMDHRRLRRFVMTPADAAIGNHAADRGDVDYPAFAARKHRAADHLGADEAVRKIEIDETLPGFEIGVLDRHVEIAAADIVDEDVDGGGFGENAAAEIFAYGGLG